MKNLQALVPWLLLIALAAPASGQPAVPDCDIDGLLGMTPVETQSCAAIWLSVPEGRAVAGVNWFNNDGNVVFPRVWVASGQPDQPATLASAVVAAEAVQGVSSGWSQVMFAEPVACLSEGLYCLFELPPGSEYTGPGTGGGAAFGYTADDCGHQGWLSRDDEDRVRIAGGVGLAIDPILVQAEPGMIRMARPEGAGGVPMSGLPVLQPARPNPFNPQTALAYSLPVAARVELSVYDLRGRLVRRLVDEEQAAGQHDVTWQADDAAGRRVPSGVYLVRFRAGQTRQSQRLLLLK